MSHTESIERRIDLDAPPEDVWDAVVDPVRLVDWFGAHVEWDLEPGGRATFTFPDGTQRPARVDEVAEGRAIVFHYLPVERDVDGTTRKVPGSTVEITIEPHGDGTRLRVVERTQFTEATPRFLPGYGSAMHVRGGSASAELRHGACMLVGAGA